MLFYLVLPDGGKVEFKTTRYVAGGEYQYFSVVTGLIDPFGQRTAISYDGSGDMTQITEPGGRYIQLFYTTISTWSLLDHITGSDGRTVQYNYTTGLDGNPALTSVTYFGDSTITASYTYQQANVDPTNNFPLLATCDDPMYAGPMKKISYTFATANQDSTIPVAYGQIASENSGTTGQMVSQLVVPVATPAGSNRTENRGDGPSRSFTYSTAGFLTSFTDFYGVAATQGYDTNGFLNSYTDRNGNQTSLTNDPGTGNILTITYPSTPSDTPTGTPRGTVTYVYGSSTCPDPNNKDPHYLYSATDEGGHATTYLRDSQYRVTTINYPDTGIEKYTYDPSFGAIASHQLKAGGTETFSYYNTVSGDPAYENGLPKEYRDAYHPTGNANLRYQYDTSSRLSAVTDALGTSLGDANHTTSYLYDSRGQVTTTTLPVDPNDQKQHTVVNAYNYNTGTLTSVTDQLGNVTSYTYDDYRRVRSVTSPGHNTPVTATTYYDANGTGENYQLTANAPTFVVLPAGEITKTVYDNNLRKSTVTVGYNSADRATTQYFYDNNGNVKSVTDPMSHSSSTAYDQRDRVMSTTDALNNTTTFMYDAAGRKASVTRANGQMTTFDSYDPMNRLLQQTAKQTPDPDAVTKHSYFPSGLLQTMQDPYLVASNSTYSYSYQYDLMGRKQQLTYPPDSSNVQRTESWSYDNTGNGVLLQFTNRKGNVQTLVYDNFNRVTSSTWNDGVTPAVTTKYDAASRVTGITNTNSTITRAYYNDGLLDTDTSKYADGINRTVTYTYDPDGRRASLTYPNSAYTFTYTYTGRGQLDLLQASGSTVVSHGYDLNGNLTTRAPNNSTSTAYGYDWMNRCNSITHSLNGTTRTLTYQYDSVGNRQWVKRDGSLGDAYGYDLADQVNATQLNIANPDTSGPGSTDIVYDANGNRTSFAANGPTDTYGAANSLNQYTTRTSGGTTTSAVYDANGNMITGLDGSTYTYDAQNRVLTATTAGTTDTFLYDGLNRQVGKKIGSGSMYYRVYDGWDLLGEYLKGSANAYWAYLYGAGGIVKNLVTNNYYYQDASGSTTHLANSSGTLIEAYRYDLQGTPVFLTPTGTVKSDTSYGVRHLFTGQQWYNELKLYDLRNRYYSPDIGRFLQGDPIGFGGDATNLYRYCGNNPLTRSDPTGMLVYGTLEGTHITKMEGGGRGRSGFWGSRGFYSDEADGINSTGDGSAAPGFESQGIDVSGVSDVTVQQAEFNYSMGGTSLEGAYNQLGFTIGASGSVGSIDVRRATDAQTGLYSDGTSPGSGAPAVLSALGNVVGKIWNIPNDVLGLTLAVAGLPFGGEHWQFANNALEVTGNPVVNLIAPAITLGNVINCGTLPTSPPDYVGPSYIDDNVQTGAHEEGHTYQSQLYGPLFIPAYIGAQIFKSAFPYTSPYTGKAVNPFEAGADRYATGGGW